MIWERFLPAGEMTQGDERMMSELMQLETMSELVQLETMSELVQLGIRLTALIERSKIF